MGSLERLGRRVALRLRLGLRLVSGPLQLAQAVLVAHGLGRTPPLGLGSGLGVGNATLELGLKRVEPCGEVGSLGLELREMLAASLELTSGLGPELVEPRGEACPLGLELVEPLPLCPALLPQIVDLLALPLQLLEPRRESCSLGLELLECVPPLVPLALQVVDRGLKSLELVDALQQIAALYIEPLERLPLGISLTP